MIDKKFEVLSAVMITPTAFGEQAVLGAEVERYISDAAVWGFAKDHAMEALKIAVAKDPHGDMRKWLAGGRDVMLSGWKPFRGTLGSDFRDLWVYMEGGPAESRAAARRLDLRAVEEGQMSPAEFERVWGTES